jgi:ribosomal protein S18 acetylase RimI-like enzyme
MHRDDVIDIREAAEGDIAAVVPLYVELHEFMARGVPSRFRVADRYDEAGQRTYIQELIREASSTCLVAVDGDSVVGFAEIRIEEPAVDVGVVPVVRGHLQSLLVISDRRGGGIGSDLLQAAEQWAFDQGAQEIELDHWVFSGDPSAFYEQANYRVASRLMSKPLP